MNEDLSSSQQHPHKTLSMEARVPVGGKETDSRITGVVGLAASLAKELTIKHRKRCPKSHHEGKANQDL